MKLSARNVLNGKVVDIVRGSTTSPSSTGRSTRT
jgi:molybdopterin-binding protein